MDSNGILITWGLLLILTFFFISSALLKKKKKKNFQLPPGPPSIPLISTFFWLKKSFSQFELILRDLKSKYGPIISLKIGHRTSIFISTHSLSYKALVQYGAVFSDRPNSPPTAKIFNCNQRNISSAPYGPTWRLLRRNLTSEILHPLRIKSYSNARAWVLAILLRRFRNHIDEEEGKMVQIKVVDDFRYAMFCLLALMCFGDKLQEKQIQEIETALRRVLLSFGQFNLLNLFPRLGKILFRKRWKQVLELRREQENVLIPLIRARIEQQSEEEKERVVAYVDTLVDLELPDEKRKLNDGEMVSLCSEFLNAGTDTTSTALQWIMANLVKYPDIQDKLYREIVEVVGMAEAPPLSNSEVEEIRGIEEEDLQRMPYLKAVVLEALRRHPPGHFVLPHSVSKDVELEGYVVPKNSTVNFMVAEMGWDPQVWDDPMEFKPERFLDKKDASFDISCSREIKMMPFGAGRRICPGWGLALLHLEYFVANLVWYYQWQPTFNGDEVDLSEKQEFTVVMKNPLMVHICPRF